MKTFISMVLAALPAVVLASNNLEVTDPSVIQAFLSDPQTHAYDIKDPTWWKSYRKILQIGVKQSDGSCRYPVAVSTPGTYVSFATEIAVNNVLCESLVLEGDAGGGPTGLSRAAQTADFAAPAQDPGFVRPMQTAGLAGTMQNASFTRPIQNASLGKAAPQSSFEERTIIEKTCRVVERRIP